MNSLRTSQYLVILTILFPSLFFQLQAFADNIYVNSDGVSGDAVPGNGICETAAGNGTCTLHAAIQEANALPPASTILFTDKFSIDVCDLPALTAGQTVINAYDQWDIAVDSPGVDLFRSSSCISSNYTLLLIDSSNNHVYGLKFRGNTAGVNGVKIVSGSGNVIGADTAHHRNVFLTTGYGVENVSGNGHNTISSNYFGTMNGINSTAFHGSFGVRNISSDNTISDNLITQQDSTVNSAGIFLSGSSNIIENNIIGLNKNMNASLPNSHGVYMEFANTNDINSNTIGGNSTYGIWLGTSSNNNDFNNNLIGDTYTLISKGNLNHGIYATSLGINTIRNNKIGLNGGSGIHGSGDLTIKGNEIVYNQLHGIHLSSTGTGTIGGGSYLDPAIFNQIYGNTQHGIYLEGSSSVTISGNYIGQNRGGGARGNLKVGILLDAGANGNVIGGDDPTAGNWISSNEQGGITLLGANATNNSLKNNVIGSHEGMTGPLPVKLQGISLFNGPHDNTIGGDGVGNKIFACGANGIYIGLSDNNLVHGNMIGSDGTHNWGNTNNGISIWEGAGNVIFKNIIAYNSPSSTFNGGIKIQGATAIHNKMSQNSIHDNGGFGIELSSSANTPVTSPIITRDGNTVSGTTCSGCTVEVFTDALEQGRYYEGSTVADGTGNFFWTGTFQGRFITTTATDAAMNTSMFSSAIPAPFPWVMFLPAIKKAQ